MSKLKLNNEDIGTGNRLLICLKTKQEILYSWFGKY